MNSKKIFNGLHQVFSPILRAFAGRTRFALSVSIALLIALTVSAVSIASSDEKREKKSSDEIEVKNFGKVTDAFYRGAQPDEDGYGQLASLKIKTIIDLRDDPKDYALSMAQRNGLKYINLPMSDKEYPSPDSAGKFLALVNDKANQPIYVHCAGGRHRTGAMIAVYRMKIQGWDVERAYDEMKDYDFYTRWGHKAMKKFVFDYYRELLLSRKEEQKNPSTYVGGEDR
ncbi:MAG: fused DSP-PTPase phosphatase/NAD kinase-like protein [Blastocatellia bacterium]